MKSGNLRGLDEKRLRLIPGIDVPGLGADPSQRQTASSTFSEPQCFGIYDRTAYEFHVLGQFY